MLKQIWRVFEVKLRFKKMFSSQTPFRARIILQTRLNGIETPIL